MPKDGRGVGQRTLQPLVAAHERPIAQVEPFVKDLPELVHVPTGGERHIHQINGDNALIEATVILRLTVFVHIGCQEGAAAHTGIAVSLAVLVHLQLEHFLLADIIGHHPLCGAAGSKLRQVPVGRTLADIVLLQNIDKLRERRRDPNALFVLHTLITLQERLLDNQRKILLLALTAGFIQIHKHGDKGRLSVGGHQGDDLILNGLHTAANLLAEPLLHDLVDLFIRRLNTERLQLTKHGSANLLAADLHKGCQMRQADGLPAILVGGNLRNDLGSDVTGG